jgi:hypothetical protein
MTAVGPRRQDAHAQIAERIARLAGRLEHVKAGGGDIGVLAAGLTGALRAASRWEDETATGTVYAELRFTRTQAAFELLDAIERSLIGFTP